MVEPYFVAYRHFPHTCAGTSYFKKALRDRYAEARQVIDSAKAKRLEEQKAKQSEKRLPDFVAEQENAKIHQVAREAFNAMPEDRRRVMIEEFKTTLVGPLLVSFRKSGIESKMLSATFSGWL